MNRRSFMQAGILNTELVSYALMGASLLPEQALLWRMQCSIWQKQNRPDLIADVVPSALEIVIPAGSAIVNVNVCAWQVSLLQLHVNAGHEFVSLQLLRLSAFVSMDEVGRAALRDAAMKALSSKDTPLSHIEEIMAVLRRTRTQQVS